MGNNIVYSIDQLYEMFKEKYPDLKVKYIDSVKGNYRIATRKDNDVERLEWYPRDILREYIKSI